MSPTPIPQRGVIEQLDEAHEGLSTLRLDDGKRLVFFPHSCLGFRPASGATAFVWSTTPSEAGERAVVLTGSPTQPKPEISAAMRASDARAAAIIATLVGKAAAAREAAQVREHVRRHLDALRPPARPTRARFVGGPMPKLVTSLRSGCPPSTRSRSSTSASRSRSTLRSCRIAAPAAGCSASVFTPS